MAPAGSALAELQSKLEAANKKQLMSEKQIVARVAEARRLGEELGALKKTHEQSEVQHTVQHQLSVSRTLYNTARKRARMREV